MSRLKAPIPRQRVALAIQYNGSDFHGWQRQPRERSVQQTLETAIETVVGHRAVLHGAGRTDTGVHAACQVAHFDTDSPIPGEKWAAVLNARTPRSINLSAAASVRLDWHARFSATWRRYRYTIYTARRANLFFEPFVWHYYREYLDAELMLRALEPLLGRHHLSAFRRAGSSRADSWVEVQEVRCDRVRDFISIEVQASGFLYGMMRLLVGTLVQVGRGQRSLESFEEIWTNERRELVKYAAPAKGLCFLRVGYDNNPFPTEAWYSTMPHYSFDPLPC
ncbi:MAG: tRNA pseudouridine(38-40) synthase TruA [Geitlerinemataceae cyanobacterium]